MNYFISDTHFSHTNIIKYTNRPFISIEEMNQKIIFNWNSRVNDNDTVFHLGDWGFVKSTEAPNGKKFDIIRKQLKGNIIFLNGSHDNNNGCRTIIEAINIKCGGYRIFLIHNPKYAKQDSPLIFHGHLHGKYGMFNQLSSGSILVDLSVENIDYRPITINEILRKLEFWKKGVKNGK